jgi:hypothetical protein
MIWMPGRKGKRTEIQSEPKAVRPRSVLGIFPILSDCYSISWELCTGKRISLEIGNRLLGMAMALEIRSDRLLSGKLNIFHYWSSR